MEKINHDILIYECGETEKQTYNTIEEWLITEDAKAKTYHIHNGIYPIVEQVLNTAPGDSRFRSLCNDFISRNIDKLNAQGPTKLCAFTDTDKEKFFALFGMTAKEITKLVKTVTQAISKTTNFLLLTQNPIFCLFYMCIRFYSLRYTKQKTPVNQKGLGSALAIYALASYPSVYSKYWKFGYADEEVMNYTIDHLSQKFIFKQQKHVFGALTFSINNSYNFLKESIEKDDCDSEVIRFIQRIRNDQNSMFKKLYDQYKTNYTQNLRVTSQKEEYDGSLVDDNYNNTSYVELVTRKVLLPILSNGVDLQRAQIAAKIAQISISDSRLYISRILTDKHSEEIEKFIESILFLYLYGENKKPSDINTKYFITWSNELFRKTNSNDENIRRIKDTLDDWGEAIGVHEKFKREASRINYKRAIFFYFIFSIQAYSA